MSELILPDDVFQTASTFFKTRSGLALGKEKIYLLDNRLTPIAIEHGYDDAGGLLKALHEHKLGSDLKEQMIEALTTNETLFLRDQKPFDAFVQKLLPAITESNKGTVNLWCAACSSGQEPYSILMHTEQTGGALASTRIHIHGTDLSGTMVERAKTGIYSQFEVQRGLPIQYLLKYFNKLDNNRWQLKDELKTKVSFQTGNLLEPFAQTKKYDAIFCRNVLIYFDSETKKDIVTRMTPLMAPNGYLVIGASESIDHLQVPGLKPVEGTRGIYQRV